MALEDFRAALWWAWTQAGPVSYNEFEKVSKKVLGSAFLPASTVHGILKAKGRRRPPAWVWVLQFWKVLRVAAAEHGVDPESLGTLDLLKRLHEAADPSQRRVQQLAGSPTTGTEGRPFEDGCEATAIPWQRGTPVFPGEDAPELASIREQVGTDWWLEYRDVVPPSFEAYLSLEPAASMIHVYDTAVVPGLLQTEAYASAALRLEPCTLPEASLSRMIELRMRRQQIIGQPNGPRLWVILDESALRRRIGGAEVMRGQLAHLIAISKQPNVSIQVIPSATSVRTTLGYPLTLLRFRGHDVPDVVYIELLTSAFYPRDPAEVTQYSRVLRGQSLEALHPVQTAEYISKLLGEF